MAGQGGQHGPHRLDHLSRRWRGLYLLRRSGPVAMPQRNSGYRRRVGQLQRQGVGALGRVPSGRLAVVAGRGRRHGPRHRAVSAPLAGQLRAAAGGVGLRGAHGRVSASGAEPCNPRNQRGDHAAQHLSGQFLCVPLPAPGRGLQRGPARLQSAAGGWNVCVVGFGAGHLLGSGHPDGEQHDQEPGILSAGGRGR